MKIAIRHWHFGDYFVERTVVVDGEPSYEETGSKCRYYHYSSYRCILHKTRNGRTWSVTRVNPPARNWSLEKAGRWHNRVLSWLRLKVFF